MLSDYFCDHGLGINQQSVLVYHFPMVGQFRPMH